MAGSRLSGRTAIVTGAARGIGAAYARGLAAEGAAVCLCDVSDPAPVAAQIRAAGGEAMSVVADVTSPDAVGAAVRAAEAWHGGIQVLVNNAGVFATLKRKPFYEIPSDEWDWVMAVNTRGSFECAKAVAPIMRRQKYGKIINIASGTLFKGSTGMMQYVASKGAVVAMTRVMARELGEDNICVNCIAPGLTLSEGVTENEDHIAGVPANAATRCFKRPEKPEDLVGAVLFFASAESDFVTGQTLLVDGGAVFN
jgi:NAD(P)-dependent dehydrogenase (short-subunit alcohol dehydrogenase family)